MQNKRTLLSTILIATLALVGCQGGLYTPRTASLNSFNAVRQSGAGWLTSYARASQAGLIYVSDNWGNTVNIYSKQSPHELVGRITDGLSQPMGMALDDKGDLFVANFAKGTQNGWVSEYKAGETEPSFTYSTGLQYPDDVAVSNGKLYVVDPPAYTVVEFPLNKNAPSLTIPTFGWSPNSAVVTSSQYLYVGGVKDTEYNGLLYKYAPGSKRGVNQNITAQAGIFSILIDRSNNLTLDTSGFGVWYLDYYPQGWKVPKKHINEQAWPRFMTLDAKSNLLYVAYSSGSDNYNSVNVYTYPSLKQVDSLFNPCPLVPTCWGVAVKD